MFEDIIIDKKKIYKKELKDNIQEIIDSFKFEPNNVKTRKTLHDTLKEFLDIEKSNNKIKTYLIDISEKKINVEVEV